jgi:uncharacterized protein with NRDE domain
LILAANRDEFYERPSAQADFWNENPDILAGKDLIVNGTWLGITKQGKIAAVTNYRDFYVYKDRTEFKSRGKLVTKFLTENFSLPEYFSYISLHGNEYNSYNLIFGNSDELFHYSNISNRVTKIENGIHGISNHLLNTAWPKVHWGKLRLRDIVSRDSFIYDEIFDLLADSNQFDDELLPDTGVGIDYERVLSPIFIKSPIYGTRSSTLITIDRNNYIKFIERTFDHHADGFTFINHEFQIE